jgi:16S rRNA (guanine527-N7)-methyltransferase
METSSTVRGLAATFCLEEDQAAALSRYVDLVMGWRQSNVTGVRTREGIVRLLLGDALALLDVPHLQERMGADWLDLGAGAGIPGLPLTVASSTARLTLLESVERKCAFLEEAVKTLGLAARATIVCARSERYSASGMPGREAFDVVLAKAVAPLPVLVELAAPLLKTGGVLLASKTHAAMTTERAGGEAAADLCGLGAGPIVPLPRSPLDEAVCAVYEKLRPTPARLPRREGMAAKRPLAT